MMHLLILPGVCLHTWCVFWWWVRTLCGVFSNIEWCIFVYKWCSRPHVKWRSHWPYIYIYILVCTSIKAFVLHIYIYSNKELEKDSERGNPKHLSIHLSFMMPAQTSKQFSMTVRSHILTASSDCFPSFLFSNFFFLTIIYSFSVWCWFD